MQKCISIIFFLALSQSLIAQTNKYYNAYENWTQIHESSNMGVPYAIQADYFYINGDTIINSKIFKKLFFQYKISEPGGIFSPYQGSPAIPSFYIKEENDTILAIKDPSAIEFLTDTVWVKIDFNDSIIYEKTYRSDLSSYQNNEYNIFYIEDSILINGITRRIIYTSLGKTYEGTLASYGPLLSSITDPDQFDGYTYLECYGGNDSTYLNCIWASPIYPGCPGYGNCNIDSLTHTLGIDYTNEISANIFPNPTHDRITIGPNSGNTIKGVYAIDMFGTQFALPSTNNNEWDISTLMNGVYLLKISIGDKTLYEKIVKQ